MQRKVHLYYDFVIHHLQEEGKKSVFRLDLVALKKMNELKTPDSKSNDIYVFCLFDF